MAKESYSAGDLNISIQTIADDTLAKLDAVVERLTFINTQLGGITSKARGTKRVANSRGRGSNGSPLSFTKLGLTIYSMRRLGRFMGNLVQAGSDYYETLNLWQVAMRNNLDVADQFINKMNKAYGISSNALMNAQATFKNMIGSLGQVTDETAYRLSEALVQMSADYASLYNRTLESAVANMQSMLAGQVRPIRSAGLDMTETTLFMFYQQLGGTKTMRQLNRTEKQLLSILAVYKQMGSAGALGDMSKTLNQFANQSRMMTEYWAELKTWSGLILKDLLEEWGVLKYINAALITMTEIVKAIAKSRGLGEENFIDGMFESVEATNDAVDELQGKLLDFDKFRSLEGASASPLAIDEKLLEAITGYSSLIDEAINDAKILADTWLKFWLTDDDKLTPQAEALLGVLKAIGVILGVLVGYKIALAIKAIGVALLNVNPAIMAMSIGFVLLFNGIRDFLSLWDDLSPLGRALDIILALTAGIIGMYIAIKSFSLSPVGALAAGAALAGGVLSLSAMIKKNVMFAANGASDIDGGTLFVAGEMGRTEAVYTGSNGKTNVANVQQMKAAYKQALTEWWSTAKNDVPSLEGVSDSGLYTIVSGEAHRRGKRFEDV
jgi:hypothetical protein